MVNHQFILSKSKNSLIRELSENGFVFPNHYTGHGSRTRLSLHKDSIVSTLKELGVSFGEGNNAPRGGAIGDFIILTSRTTEIKDERKKQEYNALKKKIVSKWSKPRKYSSQELMDEAGKAIKWCDEVYREGDADILEHIKSGTEDRYWLTAYFGCGTYRLVISDGRIVASLPDGFHNSRPLFEGKKEVEKANWIKALDSIVKQKLNGKDYSWVKADGSGTHFYLRNQEDVKLLHKVSQYTVPDVSTGLAHLNLEIH